MRHVGAKPVSRPLLPLVPRRHELGGPHAPLARRRDLLVAPVGVSAPGTTIPNGAFPVVRPDGSLVLLFTVTPTKPADTDAVVAARSTDGGVSFGVVTTVAEQFEEQIFGVRAPAFVSADVDAAGTVYAVWSDCRFQPECGANSVVVVTSRDGVTWTEPRAVPFLAPGDVDWIVPALAVQPGTSGACRMWRSRRTR